MLGRSRARRPVPGASRSRRRLFALEALEERSLLSISTVLAGGILHIESGDGPDAVLVQKRPDGKIAVYSGRTALDLASGYAAVPRTQLFNSAAVRGIKFIGNGGDDDFSNQTDRPVWADLGSGHDRFSGGSGNDVVKGGLGNDVITGLGGNDCIDGGDDEDVLIGGGGDDAVFGGLGHDQVRGDGGNDWLFGGSGRDTLWGGTGKDFLDGGQVFHGLAFADGWDDTLHMDDGEDAPLDRQRDVAMKYIIDVVHILWFEAQLFHEDTVDGHLPTDAFINHRFDEDQSVWVENRFRQTGAIGGVDHSFFTTPDFSDDNLKVGSTSSPLVIAADPAISGVTGIGAAVQSRLRPLATFGSQDHVVTPVSSPASTAAYGELLGGLAGTQGASGAAVKKAGGGHAVSLLTDSAVGALAAAFSDRFAKTT